MAIRARLVVDCADLGVAEAARRSSVNRATVAKWWRRYVAAGVEGLRDAPRTGRPTAPDVVVRRVLACALDEPPAGADSWTTRAVADITGVSQATVSRIRRRYFRRPDPAFLGDLSTSILTYVDVHPSGCALGLWPSSGVTPGGTSPVRTDVIETVICAALLPSRVGGNGEAAHSGSDAVMVLRRAVERLQGISAVTLLIDAELDTAARKWLSRHPEIRAHAVTDGWLGLLHPLADAVDSRQLAELREVQRLIRRARSEGAGEFTWCRPTPASARSVGRAVSDAETEPLVGNLTQVVRGICTAITEGDLRAGDPISARRIARRASVSPGRVADALAQLAEESLIDKHEGRYLLPVPAPRDVMETYTARGLLGTAIVRRLASDRTDLPIAVDEKFAGLIRCDELGLIYEAGSIDLDIQDELAAASNMPRIGSMFIRLTLQLRIFISIFGLNYRYPIGEIVVDDTRILADIRRHDPERAVTAWRSKIDNAARFMLTHLRPIR